MDALAALIGQWRRLGRDSGVDLEPVAVSVLDLMARLTTAVPSLLGLTVTTAHSTRADTVTLTLTAVGAGLGRPALTSLRFSFLQRGTTSAGVVLYAHQAGALVDLDADLSYVSSLGRDRPDSGVAPTIVGVRLDRDLPAPALTSGLLGWGADSSLNRAEGVLIDHGVHPDDAGSELRLRAGAAGLDPHAYAKQLLAAPNGAVGGTV